MTGVRRRDEVRSFPSPQTRTVSQSSWQLVRPGRELTRILFLYSLYWIFRISFSGLAVIPEMEQNYKLTIDQSSLTWQREVCCFLLLLRVHSHHLERVSALGFREDRGQFFGFDLTGHLEGRFWVGLQESDGVALTSEEDVSAGVETLGDFDHVAAH